jgi:hypothetical protein
MNLQMLQIYINLHQIMYVIVEIPTSIRIINKNAIEESRCNG